MPEQTHQYENVPTDSNAPQTRRRRKRSKCMCIACIFLLILLFAAVSLLILLLLIVGNQSPVIDTNCGSLEGDFDTPNNVFVFRGIPYAVPPEGKRRWKQPEPLTKANGTCWKGTYKAHYDPLQCTQRDIKTRTVVGSEDCLYMNIYTPSIDPMTPLPVMVYIHGGFLQWGNSYTPGYTPDAHIAGKLGVVFVSIQYRLNVFGFLVLDELSGSGNYGYWDQIEALKWVQENIHAFGGDPDDVTIFGQSSGGTSVWSLMMSPLAKGLFHKVWSLSGSPIFNKTLSDARMENAFFVNKSEIQRFANSNCARIVSEECLQKVPRQDIVTAVYEEWDPIYDSMNLPTKGYFEKALPVIDGHLFPDEPLNLIKQKVSDKYSDVPVIFGTTAQELDFEPAPFEDVGFEFDSWTEAEFIKYVAKHFDPFGDTKDGQSITNKTLSLYPYRNTSYTYANMASDFRVICGMDSIARKTSAAFKSPVYHYVATAFPSYPAHPLGTLWNARYAFHSIDIFAFFDSLKDIYNDGSSPTRQDEAFMENVQAEIMHFVRHGVMKSADWQPMPNATALLSQTTSAIKQYHKEQCEFWQEYGFLNYAWIN